MRRLGRFAANCNHLQLQSTRSVSATTTSKATATLAPSKTASSSDVSVAWKDLPLSSKYPEMSTDEMVRLCKQHTIYTWTAGNAINPLPVVRAEGAYMYTPSGEKILDFNAQLMSVNIGHGDPRVKEAMKRQIDELIFVNPQVRFRATARVHSKERVLLLFSFLSADASFVPIFRSLGRFARL